MKKIIIAFITFGIIGCASNSAFMDARPTGLERQTYTGGISFRGKFCDSAGISMLENVDLSFIPIDFIGSFSLTDQVDFITKYTFPLTLDIGVKLSLDSLQPGKIFYSAIGFGVGIDITSLLHDTIKDPVYFDIRLPVYQTMCISDYFAISAVPSLWIRNDYRKFQFLAGGGINFRIGRNAGTYLESSVFYNTRYHEPEYQFGSAFYINVKRKKQVVNTLQ